MSLYIGVFDGDREIDGWVFGRYSDFGLFRDYVRRLAGDGFPTLLSASDATTIWSPIQSGTLRAEIAEVRRRLAAAPAVKLERGFEHTKAYRATARSAAECFHNVDGENLFDALDALCAISISGGHPIVFQ